MGTWLETRTHDVGVKLEEHSSLWTVLGIHLKLESCVSFTHTLLVRDMSKVVTLKQVNEGTYFAIKCFAWLEIASITETHPIYTNRLCHLLGCDYRTRTRPYIIQRETLSYWDYNSVLSSSFCINPILLHSIIKWKSCLDIVCKSFCS